MPIQQEQFLETLEEAKAWRQNARQLYEGLRQILETSRRGQIVGTLQDNLEVLVMHWNFPSDTEITYYDRYYHKHARRNLKARFNMQSKRQARAQAKAPQQEAQAPSWIMPESVEDSMTPEQAEAMFQAPAPSDGQWPIEELEKFLKEQG